MRARAHTLPVVCAVLAAVAGSGGRASAIELVRRPIDVASPGLVVVELDAAALARLGDGGGVEVLDPEGARLDAERRTVTDDAPCRPVEIAALGEQTGGWTVSLDLGPAPAPHAGLRFELDEAVLAAGCRLEGSGNGERWSPLATGDLFRLGEGGTLARTRLDYPTTTVRYLRLHWPRAAGYPEVRAVRVCAPEEPRPAPRLEIGAESRAAGPASGLQRSRAGRWVLPLPPRAARVRALLLERDAGGASSRLAWRIELAQDGRWHAFAAGTWPAGERELRVDLGDAAFPGGALRLELWGADEPGLDATWELTPQRLRFVAHRPGRHWLRLPAPPRGARVEARSTGEPILATLGPESVERVPSATGDGLGGEAPRTRFAARWRVAGPSGIEIGAPVALALPALDGIAAADRSDVRLISGGRLVPARIERAHQPESSMLSPATAPVPAGPGRSRLALAFPGGAGRPLALRLRVPPGAGPFRRALALVGRAGGGAAVPEQVFARATWECEPDPPRPCELSLELHGFPARDPALEVEDGDAAPLPALEVELEREQEQALFLWPGGEVELTAGAPELPAPRFDLAALDAALAWRRAVAAETTAGGSEPAWLERQGRTLLLVAVGVAALALLGLLARLLPRARARS